MDMTCVSHVATIYFFMFHCFYIQKKRFDQHEIPTSSMERERRRGKGILGANATFEMQPTMTDVNKSTCKMTV